MPSEEQLREATAQVLEEMELGQWQISTHSYYSPENSNYSLKVVISEPPQQNLLLCHPPYFIQLKLISDSPEGNIDRVLLNYGFTLQSSSNFSVSTILDQNQLSNHREGSIRDVPWLVQMAKPEAEMNLQTSRAYEFMSKLIQKLSYSSHPEVS